MLFCYLLCGHIIKFGFPHFRGSMRVLLITPFSSLKKLQIHTETVMCTINTKYVNTVYMPYAS